MTWYIKCDNASASTDIEFHWFTADKGTSLTQGSEKIWQNTSLTGGTWTELNPSYTRTAGTPNFTKGAAITTLTSADYTRWTIGTPNGTATAPASGDGSSGNPYQIATLNNLNWIAQNSGSWGNYFTQTADIDASTSSTWQLGAGFSPIGNATTKFTGNYDGNGYKVMNLSVNRPSTDYIGLFGLVDGSGVINSLGVTGANVSGHEGVGALVGMNYGTVNDCYATGSTITVSYMCAGVLVGWNEQDWPANPSLYPATITRCYSEGSISGDLTAVGGLVGWNNGPINDSYSRASVSGNQSVGGLIGKLWSGVITNCYSTGAVSGGGSGPIDIGGLVGYNNLGTVNNCFWDVTNSGIGTDGSTDGSAGGTGKTTTEMQTASTFLDAGWSGSIWNIDATKSINNGYPYLKWQNTSGTPIPVELTSFAATTDNLNAKLTWKTATEVNNYGFDIERRLVETVRSQSQTSTLNWGKIGFVKGNGTSNSPKEYSYTDASVASGAYAYRLKQIDNCGAFKYSQEAEVTVVVPESICIESELSQSV